MTDEKTTTVRNTGPNPKIGDVLLATAKDLTEANEIRRLLMQSRFRLWVFVFRNVPKQTYSVTASNEWSGALSAVAIVELTQLCKDFLSTQTEDIEFIDVEEQEPITERHPSTES